MVSYRTSRSSPICFAVLNECNTIRIRSDPDGTVGARTGYTMKLKVRSRSATMVHSSFPEITTHLIGPDPKEGNQSSLCLYDDLRKSK
mmetsp:Transcript_7328/g.13237  ORF Transcript_7328/g.13237 Transcript_7328/m.13237 type:complete len:88 (-) Transcript_7328:885-1148(-)